MKVYIFGAGASYGSQDRSQVPEQNQAPLINNLFDSQYSSHAAATYVSQNRINELKTLIGDRSLEEWLTKEWIKTGEPHGKEALAAGRKLFGDLALYIWWTMVNVSGTYNDSNLYNTFLQKLADLDDKDEQAFINFNYDLLLDKALNKLYGYNLSATIESYTTYNYLKPHGSVNWFVDRRADKDQPVNDLDRGADQSEILLNRIASNIFKGESIEKRLKILDPFNRYLYDFGRFFNHVYVNGDYGFPLVLLPMSSKMDDLIEGFVDRIRAEFPRIFKPATDVYVIGYRANDSLFNEMIALTDKSNKPKLHVVGTEKATEIQKSILDANPNLQAGNVFTDGFAGFIKAMK